MTDHKWEQDPEYVGEFIEDGGQLVHVTGYKCSVCGFTTESYRDDGSLKPSDEWWWDCDLTIISQIQEL